MCNSVNCAREATANLRMWADGVINVGRYQNPGDELLDRADGLRDSDKHYLDSEDDLFARGVETVALATALHEGVLTGEQVGSMLTNLPADDINTAVLIKLEDADVEPMGLSDLGVVGGCNCVAA